MDKFCDECTVWTFIIPKTDFVLYLLFALNTILLYMLVSALLLLFVLCFSYREKALLDAAAVSRHVEYLLQSVGKVSV